MKCAMTFLCLHNLKKNSVFKQRGLPAFLCLINVDRPTIFWNYFLVFDRVRWKKERLEKIHFSYTLSLLKGCKCIQVVQELLSDLPMLCFFFVFCFVLGGLAVIFCMPSFRSVSYGIGLWSLFLCGCWYFIALFLCVCLLVGKEAGDALVSKANISLKQGERDEAASAYMDASKAYRKGNPIGNWCFVFFKIIIWWMRMI